ncbi:Sugar transport protein [Pleurostoma richardsiae]|uniref:Sugar transport protein n=1 Tax=Pleurostoma richardsiae TaxID=41990 RepID=A0AA38RVB5_9PEZI|nr:Sugar transport protein [Pleurostoma richardsiae]
MIPLYIRAVIVTSCVAMLFGLDTGTIGPVTTMPEFEKTFGTLSATVHGVVVSSILLPGAISALVSGVLADKYGRIRLIVCGSLVYGIGAAIECSATILGVFILGRLIKGVGNGLFLSTVYVQVCEISPAKNRGTMSSLPQFALVTGLLVGFFTCYGSARIEGSTLSWRLPIALASVLAFSFAAVCSLCPPSPRWLLATGQVEQARAVVAALGLHPAEQEELLAQSQAALEHAPGTSFLESLRATFADFGVAFSPPFRARTAMGCFLMSFQQLSGIDGILYYAPVLFRAAGLGSDQAAFLASGVSAIVIFVVTVAATLLADAWGRRTATLVGGVGISALMLTLGSLYAGGEVHADRGAARWVVIVGLYLFAIVFNATWALSIRTYLIESLPRRTRSSASALGQSSNWVTNYLVALTTPILIARSTYGAYYFFAFSTMLATVVVALFMSETKGRSLEVIEATYLEDASRSTGRWNAAMAGFKGFKMRRIRVSVEELSS